MFDLLFALEPCMLNIAHTHKAVMTKRPIPAATRKAVPYTLIYALDSCLIYSLLWSLVCETLYTHGSIFVFNQNVSLLFQKKGIKFCIYSNCPPPTPKKL